MLLATLYTLHKSLTFVLELRFFLELFRWKVMVSWRALQTGQFSAMLKQVWILTLCWQQLGLPQGWHVNTSMHLHLGWEIWTLSFEGLNKEKKVGIACQGTTWKAAAPRAVLLTLTSPKLKRGTGNTRVIVNR